MFKKYTGIFAISYNGVRLVEFVNKNINKLQNKLIILDNASSHRRPKDMNPRKIKQGKLRRIIYDFSF